MTHWSFYLIILNGIFGTSNVMGCSIGLNDYRGLLPLLKVEHTGNMTGRACNYFWSCDFVPGKDSPVRKMQDCRDAGSETPYFNTKTCNCVETEAECEDNEDLGNRRNCVRIFNAREEVEETCESYGTSPISYVDRFPNLNDPKRFWYCRPQNATHTKTETCDWTDSFNRDIIWSQRDCSHIELSNNETLKEAILNFNTHPQNRFKCAEIYNPNKSIDPCSDSDGLFYTGKFANSGYDKNLYFQCIQNGGITPSVISVQQKCPEDQLFDINTCGCVEPENFDPCLNFNPANEKRCAAVIGSDPCRDESGAFREGQIPHEKYCNMYWNCGSNLIPYLTSCPGVTVFDVFYTTENGCACNHPNKLICENNLKPENKFRCAPSIIKEN